MITILFSVLVTQYLLLSTCYSVLATQYLLLDTPKENRGKPAFTPALFMRLFVVYFTWIILRVTL